MLALGTPPNLEGEFALSDWRNCDKNAKYSNREELMKRLLILGMIVGIGSVMLAAGDIAQQAGAGQRGGTAGLGPIATIQKVTDGLYMIPGARGHQGIFVPANGFVN